MSKFIYPLTSGTRYLIILISIITSGKYSFAQNSSFFELPIIHEIRLHFYTENYWDSLIYFKEQYEKTEVFCYHPCNINIDGVQYYYSGARLKGNSSYSDYDGKKKSFKLKLDEFVSCQDMDGFTELNLNNAHRDPTFLREKLYYDFLRENGIVAPRCAYAKLYINSIYWGIYVVTEEIDKKFIKRNFASGDGNLYKGDPKATLCIIDSNPLSYNRQYKKITHTTENNWNDLFQLIKYLNSDTTEYVYYHLLDSIINIKTMLKVWAANALFINSDSYNFGAPHNFFLYFNPDSKKMEWIPWDANYSFNAFNPSFTYTEAVNAPLFHISLQMPNRNILYNIYNNKYLKNMYLDIVNEMIAGFSSLNLNPCIDSLSNLLRSAIYADTLKMYSNQHFEKNLAETIGDAADPGGYISGLKTFIVDRRKSILQQLKKEGYKL